MLADLSAAGTAAAADAVGATSFSRTLYAELGRPVTPFGNVYCHKVAPKNAIAAIGTQYFKQVVIT